MTSQDRAKITKRMLWIIPAMLLCILGDYCMGIASSGGRLGAQQEYLGRIDHESCEKLFQSNEET